MRIKTCNNRRRQRELKLRPTLEDKIFDGQEKIISRLEKELGRAVMTNMGAVVWDYGDVVTVYSKLYRVGYIDSVGVHATGKVEHSLTLF